MPPVRWLLTICIMLPPALSMKPALLDVRTSCDEAAMNVTMEFSSDFGGVVTTKGIDCVTARGLSPILNFSLPAKRCGLRITKDNDGIVYTASVQVQMSSAVQQAADPAVQIRCRLPWDMLPIKTKLPHRTGRMMGEGGRAWLEVRGSAISTFSGSNSLSVGEHTVLAVHTRLPDGLEGRPIDCRVEDGRGSVQPLSDPDGCPTDPALVPALRRQSLRTWSTSFPAFSFPDAGLVHYTCLLMICQNHCPQFDCGENETDTRSSREFQSDEERNVVGLVELYNSVEVTAPNIELGYLKRDLPHMSDGGAGGGGGEAGEGWVCLSGPRVALVFALLGALFLGAVLATLLLLIRHRRRHKARFHYGLYT